MVLPIRDAAFVEYRCDISSPNWYSLSDPDTNRTANSKGLSLTKKSEQKI